MFFIDNSKTILLIFKMIFERFFELTELFVLNRVKNPWIPKALSSFFVILFFPKLVLKKIKMNSFNFKTNICFFLTILIVVFLENYMIEYKLEKNITVYKFSYFFYFILSLIPLIYIIKKNTVKTSFFLKNLFVYFSIFATIFFSGILFITSELHNLKNFFSFEFFIIEIIPILVEFYEIFVEFYFSFYEFHILLENIGEFIYSVIKIYQKPLYLKETLEVKVFLYIIYQLILIIIYSSVCSRKVIDDDLWLVSLDSRISIFVGIFINLIYKIKTFPFEIYEYIENSYLKKDFILAYDIIRPNIIYDFFPAPLIVKKIYYFFYNKNKNISIIESNDIKNIIFNFLKYNNSQNSKVKKYFTTSSLFLSFLLNPVSPQNVLIFSFLIIIIFLQIFFLEILIFVLEKYYYSIEILNKHKNIEYETVLDYKEIIDKNG